jgi:hypothetical protein
MGTHLWWENVHIVLCRFFNIRMEIWLEGIWVMGDGLLEGSGSIFISS